MTHQHPEAVDYAAAAPELERAAVTPVKLHRGDYRYEVRAVFESTSGYFQSQPAEHFDKQPLYDRAPDAWGVYEVYGGLVDDHPERVQAQQHCDQLNGVHA